MVDRQRAAKREWRKSYIKFHSTMSCFNKTKRPVSKQFPHGHVVHGRINDIDKREKWSLHLSGQFKQLGSLSTCVFETRTPTGREHVACQDSGVSQIFTLIIFRSVNVAVRRQVKGENSSLPVAVRVSKTRVLIKLPIISHRHLKNPSDFNGIRTHDLSSICWAYLFNNITLFSHDNV